MKNSRNIVEDEIGKAFILNSVKDPFDRMTLFIGLCKGNKETLFDVIRDNYPSEISKKIIQIIERKKGDLDPQFVHTIVGNIFKHLSESYWSYMVDDWGHEYNVIDRYELYIGCTVRTLDKFGLCSPLEFDDSEWSFDEVTIKIKVDEEMNFLSGDDLSREDFKRDFIVKPVDPSVTEIGPDTLLKVETIH